MTRDEAKPGAVVVRVRPLGSRVGKCVYRILESAGADWSHWRDLEVWTRGAWRETYPRHVDELRVATESERREAGLE